jgi:hypothetical protein
LEQRIYKRIARQDRYVQTDDEHDKPLSTRKSRGYVPKIRLPPPIAMEYVEEFLANNHWRLIDLFRTLDRDKSWNVVKNDLMRFIRQVRRIERARSFIERLTLSRNN